MATSHTLKAEKRACTGTGKLNQFRTQGLVPAVMYGAGKENMNLQINAKEFTAILAGSASDHIIIDLAIESVGTKTVLLKEVQHNRLTNLIVHVDFLEVSENTEITSTVAVILTGEPAGVKQGGVLEQHLHDIEVKCLSKDLPESITIDISKLGLNEALTIADVPFTGSLKAHLAGDVLVANVSPSSAGLSTEAEVAE